MVTYVSRGLESARGFDIFMKVAKKIYQAIPDVLFLIAGSDRTSTARLFEPEEVCYAARPNSILVRADGRLGKCTVGLSDPVNTIGRLRPDGSLEIDKSKLHPWIKGWETRDPELISCPYQGFTGNHEPLLQITRRR